MHATTTKTAYHEGIRDGLPYIVMVVPFALLFGVVAIETGLTVAQTIGFSILVIAGASQFAALQLMVENAAIGLVLLAALAVNLRMAMYSASLVPYLGAAPMWQRVILSYLNFDQTYMASVHKFETEPDMTVPARVAYFLGVATPIAPLWGVTTIIGALIGTKIPDGVPIDFILPIAFLSMVAPMVRSLAHFVALLVSVGVSLALAGLPSGLGLLIAAGCAMVTGAMIETWLEGRKT